MARDIVVIDDDENYLLFLVTVLRRAGHRVTGFADGPAAFSHLASNPAQVVITDVFMPGMDGIEVLKKLKATNPETLVIAIGGEGPRFGYSLLHAMRSLGAAATLEKPVDTRQLIAEIDRVCRR